MVDPVNAEIEYTHAGGGVVPDTDFLTYTVSDYSGAVSNTATVNITIDYYTPPVYVGSYQVFTGPDVFTNPPVYTCKEACAQVYGGVEADYSCSTSAGSVDNMAKASTWGQYGCITVAEDFSEDQGAGYDCGAPGCSTSAYVLDQCFYGGTNHCWQ